MVAGGGCAARSRIMHPFTVVRRSSEALRTAGHPGKRGGRHPYLRYVALVAAMLGCLLLLSWADAVGSDDTRIDLGGGISMSVSGQIFGALPPHAMQLPDDEAGSAEPAGQDATAHR
jgi:hypothetical protein